MTSHRSEQPAVYANLARRAADTGWQEELFCITFVAPRSYFQSLWNSATSVFFAGWLGIIDMVATKVFLSCIKWYQVKIWILSCRKHILKIISEKVIRITKLCGRVSMNYISYKIYQLFHLVLVPLPYIRNFVWLKFHGQFWLQAAGAGGLKGNNCLQTLPNLSRIF